MKIEVTEEEGLRLAITAEHEWEIFEFLLQDAEGRGEGWLAKRLGVLVDDEEWDEFVVPTLSEQFQNELNTVRTVVQQAFDRSLQQLAHDGVEPARKTSSQLAAEEDEEEECGEIIIQKAEGAHWYSVFNQARLALEGKWKLSSLETDEELTSPESVEPERLEAYLRSRFYTRLQSILLELTLDI